MIVGGTGGTNVADSLVKAAKILNLDIGFFDLKSAYQAPKLIKQINWYLRGRYPSKLRQFSDRLLQKCSQEVPKWLLTTGIAPVSFSALQKIGNFGTQRLNFLTDDPWNTAHYPPWFFKSLPYYDVVFTPRRANIDDLKKIGCQDVRYLPFGYDRDLFYPESPVAREKEQYVADVMFAGGADRDRIPYINTLIQAGMKLNLYGTYWERYSQTQAYTRGQADVRTLRLAISEAKISLCLVRRANRDDNCMRTFEVPAAGGCMLTEDTSEHRAIFGKEGEAVVYFQTIDEMLEKARWLLNQDEERKRLATEAHLLITQGHHTYRDRLKTMLELC